MERIFRYASRNLPDNIKEFFRNTKIYDYFHSLRFLTSKMESIQINIGDLKFEMMVPSCDECFKRLYLNNYEPATTALFLDNIKENDIVMDIGAHYGYFTLLAAHINRSPKNVHSFEPQPFNYHVLKYNNKKYFKGCINLINRYIGGEVKGRMITLDYYYKVSGTRPNLIKMDIEGGEINAIKGMITVLKECNPKIIIEIHPSRIIKNFHSNQRELLNTLEKLGYLIKINMNHRIKNSIWKTYNESLLNDKINSYEIFCYKE